MIVVLSYNPGDPALTRHMAEVADIYRGETVVLCTTFSEAERLVCNGRVQGRPDRSAAERVTQVIVHNHPAPARSKEPSPETAVRRFNDCWGTMGPERVLEATLFPESVARGPTRRDAYVARQMLASLN